MPAIDPKSLVHFCGVGGGSNNPATRGVHQYLVDGGYAKVDRLMVKPGLATGAKRCLLHSVAGTTIYPDGTQSMDFAAFLLAAEAGIISPPEFVKVFKPYRSKGVEVIAYLGCPTGDVNRIFAAARPVLDAQCSLMVDNATALVAGSTEHMALIAIAGEMSKYGGRLYVESVVYTVDKPHLRDIPGAAEWNDDTVSSGAAAQWPPLPAGSMFFTGKGDARTLAAEIQAHGYTAITRADEVMKPTAKD